MRQGDSRLPPCAGYCIQYANAESPVWLVMHYGRIVYIAPSLRRAYYWLRRHLRKQGYEDDEREVN